MSSVVDMIEEARRMLGEGRDKQSADVLTVAASECSDPNQARMIMSLALEGQERAGRFSKRRWDEAIRLSQKRLETSAPV
ncbi:MAG: hypothetical protein ACTHNU_02820 [Gaiellales bacterium]|jgi:hypothetical protein